MIIKIKPLLINILIPVLLGFFVGFILSFNMNTYMQLIKPALTPPDWAFSIIWTVLYALMGISAYIIQVSHSWTKNKALNLYRLQLLVNLCWPIIFFNLQLCLTAAIWLVALVVLIVCMILAFSKINPLAGWLQFPYLLWSIFALYLNISICILN